MAFVGKNGEGKSTLVKCIMGEIVDRNNALTDPKKLVRVELKNAGFDIDKIKIPDRVYLLADDIFDEMVSRNVGEYRYPLGGKLYVWIGYN